MSIFLTGETLQRECAWYGQLLLMEQPGKAASPRQNFRLGLSEQLPRKNHIWRGMQSLLDG